MKIRGTGIVRRVDDLGRIVIPKEIRRTIGIKDGDPLELYLVDEGVLFKKYRPQDMCALCEGRDCIMNVGSKSVCKKCAEAISRARDLINREGEGL